MQSLMASVLVPDAAAASAAGLFFFHFFRQVGRGELFPDAVALFPGLGHQAQLLDQHLADDQHFFHIGQLFESLDYLLARALEKPADDGGAQRRADRLGARCDMLRIALDDEQKRFGRLKSEAGGMVTFLKEYVALPEDARQTGLNTFCEQAAQSLSRVECAMMDAPQ